MNSEQIRHLKNLIALGHYIYYKQSNGNMHLVKIVNDDFIYCDDLVMIATTNADPNSFRKMEKVEL